MPLPGYRFRCDVFRDVFDGRDDTTGAPAARTGNPNDRKAHNVPCAAGEIAYDRLELGTHGGEEQHVLIGVHVAPGVDVLQGDRLILKGGSRWDGAYNVVRVGRTVVDQRVVVEANRR